MAAPCLARGDVAVRSPKAAEAATPAPTLAALRLARAQRDMLMRRLRTGGLILLAVVLVIGVRKQPGPGLHGHSLWILLGLVTVIAGGAASLLLPAKVGRVMIVPFALVAAGSVTLSWLQPGGPGNLGAVIAAIAVVRALQGRRSRVVALVCVAVGSVALVLLATVVRVDVPLHTNGRLQDGASVVIGLFPGVICVVVLLTRRMDRYSYQMERVLLDLEEAQTAEMRAVALAERQRLAREMHDVLAHSLSGLALHLEGARLLAAENPADPRLAETIERAHHLAKSGLQEARKAIGLLRDEQLPGPERMEALVNEFERDTGLQCSVTVEGDQHTFAAQARLAVYRVAQEALTNIRKHADADRVEVRLCYEPDGIRLTVEDFGRDLVPLLAQGVPVDAMAAAAGGRVPGSSGWGAGRDNERGEQDGSGRYGLAGMRERAELLGGRLTATKTPNGFLVDLWLPE
jgi:signal transduction histidine kinase